MSHGDGDTTKVNEQKCNVSRKASANDFGRGVSKMAAAQICESVGYQSFQESAMDAMTEITIRYLCDLGKIANFYANLAGRTQCNVFDIIRSLEDLKASDGFQGASEITHCLAGSGTVREIIDYVNIAEEIPFAQPIPQFPVIKNWKLIPSFAQRGETPPGEHIPEWLPAFPDPHTYIHTPIWNERATDPRADKIEQARQRRKAERSLLSLQQRLISNGSVGPSSSVLTINHNTEKESPSDESKPVLDTPLKSMGLKNSVSVLEAFAPAIEAVKGSGFCDDVDDERKVLSDVRPIVQFKFKSSKNLMGEPLDLSLQKKGSGRPGIQAGRDDERDEKKRRAEYILRQSMENPQDLMQL